MNNIKKIKEAIRNFWNWLWNSESWLSYAVFLLLIYVFIKIIFFPLLSLALGSELPLAIVESCSMFHEGNFLSDYDEWWQHTQTKYESYEISKENFSDFKFKNGFNKGDIIVLIRADSENLKIGDVILFYSPEKKTPVIHRIVEIKERDGENIVSTLGDYNSGQLSFEKEIEEEQIIGKAVFRLVPYAGWLKLIFFEYTRPENERGLCKANF